MSSEITPGVGSDVVYPESDGKPTTDNTLQWDWMVKIVGELRDQFRGERVFVAGDLFWYPVEGDPKTVTAPDGLVAFGRPPGCRGSYKQWEEDDVAPQVVFEVLSPSNTPAEMALKRRFYDRHGVEEYYVIDPYGESYEGYTRHGSGGLRAVPARKRNGWVSPRLGVKFVQKDGLKLVGPGGREFLTSEEYAEGIEEELRRTNEMVQEELERRLTAERERDTMVAQREAVIAALRAAGMNPDDFLRPTG